MTSDKPRRKPSVQLLLSDMQAQTGCQRQRIADPDEIDQTALQPGCSNPIDYYRVCSGSVVVTAYDFESGRPGSNPEWGLIYYKALITAQVLPEPSSLWGSTLGTRAAKHKGCNWGMQID